MCVYIKLFLEDLNPSPYPPQPTNIYTCEVTTIPGVHGGNRWHDLITPTNAHDYIVYMMHLTTT